MDPNTLNLDLDPDPGFWPNLDPYPIRIRIQGNVTVILSILKKKFKIILEKSNFSLKQVPVHFF